MAFSYDDYQDPVAEIDAEQAAHPVLPGENLADYDSRRSYEDTQDAQASLRADAAAIREQAQADRQQQEIVKIQRVKAKDFFGKSRIPTVDDGTTIGPIRDETGVPLRDYDRSNDIAYDSNWFPRRIEHQPDGSVALQDPYQNAPRKPDAKGNLYDAPKGLPWRWTGEQDEEIVSKNRDAATAEASTALGQQSALEMHDVAALAKDLKTRKKDLEAAIPALANAPDVATMRAAVDEHYNEQYADPLANMREGYFNTGKLTENAVKIRNAIDAEKAQVNARIAALDADSVALAASQQQAQVNAARARALRDSVVAAKLKKAEAAGAIIPPSLIAAPTGAQGVVGPDEPQVNLEDPEQGQVEQPATIPTAEPVAGQPALTTAQNAGHSLVRGALDQSIGSAAQGLTAGVSNLLKFLPGPLANAAAQALAGGTPFAAAAGAIGTDRTKALEIKGLDAAKDAIAKGRGAVKEALPVSDEYGASYPGMITAAIGQLASTLPLYTIPGLGQATSVAQIYDQAFADAKEKGASDELAHDAAVKNIPSAALDYIGDRFVFGKILKPFKGKATVGQIAGMLTQSFAAEGLTEAAQQLWMNVVAKSLSGYDPNRRLDQDVISSLIVGAATGGIVSGLGHAAVSGVRKLSGAIPEERAAVPQEASAIAAPETSSTPPTLPKPEAAGLQQTSPASTPPPLPGQVATSSPASGQSGRETSDTEPSDPAIGNTAELSQQHQSASRQLAKLSSTEAGNPESESKGTSSPSVVDQGAAAQSSGTTEPATTAAAGREVAPEMELSAREKELAAMDERDPMRPLIAGRINELRAVIAQPLSSNAGTPSEASPTAPQLTATEPPAVHQNTEAQSAASPAPLSSAEFSQRLTPEVSEEDQRILADQFITRGKQLGEMTDAEIKEAIPRAHQVGEETARRMNAGERGLDGAFDRSGEWLHGLTRPGQIARARAEFKGERFTGDVAQRTPQEAISYLSEPKLDPVETHVELRAKIMAESKPLVKSGDLKRKGNGVEAVTEKGAEWVKAAQGRMVDRMNRAANAERLPQIYQLDKANAEANHKQAVREALRDGERVSAGAVEQYGLKVPDGYVKKGDLYIKSSVTQPQVEAPAKPAPAAAAERTQANAAPVEESKAGDVETLQAREWGDVGPDDMGATVETKDGQRGRFAGPGKSAFAFQPEGGGRKVVVKYRDARVIAPKTEAPKPAEERTIDPNPDAVSIKPPSAAGPTEKQIAAAEKQARILQKSAETLANSQSPNAAKIRHAAEAAAKKAADLRSARDGSGLGAAAAKSLSPAAETARKVAGAAYRLHKTEIQALGLSSELTIGETLNAAGIYATKDGIIIDPEKLAKDTASLDQKSRLAKFKRALAEEVFHVATLRYAAENSDNFAKVQSLSADSEWAARGREAYGPEWDNLNDFQKGAEIARMIAQGRKGKLTEASFRYLKEFLKWLRKKLKNLSPATRELIAEIEARMGQYRKETPQRPQAANENLGAASSKAEASWPENFPAVAIHTNIAKLKAHPDYTAAKAGDTRAAVNVVEAITNPQRLAEIAKKFPNAIVAAVHAEEATGRNKLPIVYGLALAEAGGLQIEDRIVQVNRVHHTGTSAAHRLFATPEFTGPVEVGRDYIIVDDVTTSGSSLAGLRNHIIKGGGRVVLASTLATTSNPQTGYGGYLAMRPDTLSDLLGKFDESQLNALLSKHGIATSVRELTNSQGKYLATFRSLDAVRGRLASAGQAAGGSRGSGLTSEDKATDVSEGRLERGSGGEALFAASSSEESRLFYSQLTRTVQALPQATMTVAQARAAIEKGAKADEIKLSGILEDPLSPLAGKTDTDKVTRYELTDYAIERQTEVRDVTLGEDGKQRGPLWKALVAELKKDELGGYDTIQDAARGAIMATEGTEFNEWSPDTIAAANAYRSAQGQSTQFEKYQLPGAEPGSYREMFVTWPTGNSLDQLIEQVGARFQIKGTAGTFGSREDAIRIAEGWRINAPKMVGWSDGHAQYSEIANPVVRIRRNIRTDADGKRVYFIEEIQGPGKEGQEKMLPEVRKRIYEIGMKRALRDAVDEGADRIAWTTGEIQAERYSLEKQVDSIVYYPNSDGTWDVQVAKDGNVIHRESAATEARLSELVGKEIAAKITNDEGADYGEGKALSGLDLKVGGEGLKRLYDITLPRIANDLAKKFGVKVGQSEIASELPEDQNDPFDAGRMQHAVEGEALGLKPARKTGGVAVHSLDIPDALRDSAQDGFALFAAATPRPGEQTAEEALFFGPRIPSIIGKRLVEGSADTLERTAGLLNEGKQLRAWRDNVDKFAADATKPERDFQRAMGGDGKRITAAEKQVDEYFKAIESGDSVGAENYRKATMTDDGRAALAAWEKASGNEFEALTGLNYQVRQSDGTTRDIRKVTNFHPRTPKREYREAIANAAKDPKKAREVLKIVLKHFGEIAGPGETPKMTTEQQALEYLRGEWTNDADFDLHGSTERARELKLPSQLYDYSFDARNRYLTMSAERRAQVAAFGQAGRLDKENFFNKAIARTTDPRTAAYLAAVRDSVYGLTKKDALHKLMAGLNGIATGSHLANPITIITNLLSGMGYTGADLGAVNSAKALRAMIDDYASAKHEAEDLGILNSDLMSLYRDAERYNSGVIDKIHTGTAAALKYTGYNKSEEWVRVHQLLTAKLFLQNAIGAHTSDSNSRKAQIYTAFLKRHNVDAAELYREKGQGPETEKFYRSIIRDTQGGYRIDQVQPFLDSAEGKFLFKYQKWGFQQSRNFVRNVVRPALGKGGPVDLAPAMRYLVMTAALGAGLTALKEWLFGSPDRTASLEEIGKTWPESRTRAIALSAQKLWSAQIAAGAFGAISNYAQVVTDIAERSKFKSPLSPPGVSSITNAGEQLLRLIEQKKLTPKDVDDYLRAQIALYRTGKAAAGRVAAMTGAPVLANERARQDMAWLGTQTRRFAAGVGVEASRTSMGRVGKTEMSPLKQNLLDSLRAGDLQGAKAALKAYTDSLPAQNRGDALKSLKASVGASQPIRVGVASEPRRELFIAWAMTHLPKPDVQRVLAIDRRYRDTAAKLGLINTAPASPTKVAATVRKLKLPMPSALPTSSVVRTSSPAGSWWNPR